MKLFIWVGNPGEKYVKTRHNAGRIVLDQLTDAEGFTNFLYQKKFSAEASNGLIGKRQIISAKPQTFMNKSGQPVQALINYYQIDTEDMLVFQDDIDLPFGKIKLKFGGSPWGHNGIKDITNKLWTDKFRRLKIWVGRPAHPEHDVVDYVLNTFSSTELKRFSDNEKEIRERVGDYLRNTG